MNLIDKNISGKTPGELTVGEIAEIAVRVVVITMAARVAIRSATSTILILIEKKNPTLVKQARRSVRRR